MRRTDKIIKNLSTPQEIVNKKKVKLKNLKKEVAYLEMRENTGTKNKYSLVELMNKVYSINDIGQSITAGGSMYEE
ncbi:MAG: hypothetical protein V4721_10485 [Bacteroidota bacterium]